MVGQSKGYNSGLTSMLSGASQEVPGDWAAQTTSHLTKVSELRQEVRRQFDRDKWATEAEDKAPNIGGPVVEDRLKRRQRTTQSLAAQVNGKMESVQHVIYQVKSTVQDLTRLTTNTSAARSVVQMRMDLRLDRPPSELIEDAFSEALAEEHAVLSEILGQISGRLERGAALVQPLEDRKAEMQASRLTLHLDRSGATQQLLDHVMELERDAARFCKEAVGFLELADKKAKKASARTGVTMKQRIAATLELKEKIEKDMRETRQTITEAELHLDRLERQLQVQLAMPERQQNMGGDLCNTKLAARTGVLAELRMKIKASAYIGAQGRQLNVLFGRFDRDGSGMLDEDEVRRALRRACRIPPSVVTDAEISSLCGLLDEDQSGTVSIEEITDFLCADVNVESLEEQISWAKVALERLRAAQKQSQADLRAKVAAWKIDAACARANPIKAKHLDGLPVARPTTVASSPRVPALPAPHNQNSAGRPVTATASTRPWAGSRGSPRKPKPKAHGEREALPALTPRGEYVKSVLDAATMESVRSRIKSAAYASAQQGRQLEQILARCDKDGSGMIAEDDLRQALRRTLKISQSHIPDSDLAGLCSMLGSGQPGYVSITALIAFVGSLEPQNGKAGKSSQGASHQNGPASPPDESAGPTND